MTFYQQTIYTQGCFISRFRTIVNIIKPLLGLSSDYYINTPFIKDIISHFNNDQSLVLHPNGINSFFFLAILIFSFLSHDFSNSSTFDEYFHISLKHGHL